MGAGLVRATYLVVFGGTTLACLVALVGTRHVNHRDVRRGLLALLLTSGAWSATETARLFVVERPVGEALYLLGLGFGLATVGGWLFFTAAYAGEEFHRDRRFLTVGAVGYVVLMLVKAVNPGGAYYTASTAVRPFRHVAISLGPLHWVTYALTYVLAGVGFYLLYDAFGDLDAPTRGLQLLTALTAVPVVFTLVGGTSNVLASFNYEPVGVGVFALGTLYVTRRSFLRPTRVGRQRVTERLVDPVFVVDSRGVVRDWNVRAAELAPDVADGVQFESVLSSVGLDGVGDPDSLADGGVVEVPGDDGPRFLEPSVFTVSLGAVPVGRAVVLRDVTDAEQRRRRLENRDETLENLASAIGHEFRTTLGILQGYGGLVADAVESGDPELADQALERIEAATARAIESATHLEALARYAGAADATDPCQFGEVARLARDRVGDGLKLDVWTDGTVVANRGALQTIVEHCMQFAVENGATRVAGWVTDDGVVLTADIDPLSSADLEAAVTFNVSDSEGRANTELPTARALAVSGGATLDVEATDEGVRFGLRGMETAVGSSTERTGGH
jgi:signal transduction histidine kinase